MVLRQPLLGAPTNRALDTPIEQIGEGKGRSCALALCQVFWPPTSRFDRTNTFFLFGSSQTEAALTPRDEIIKAAVDVESREFVNQFLPCEVRLDIYVESSGNEQCAEGVKMLRADAFEEAIHYFKQAMAQRSDDDRAAYGAGVAAEAVGRYEDALKYYRRAHSMRPMPQYKSAKDRLSGHIGRIRRSGAT